MMKHAATVVLLLCLTWDINTIAAQNGATTADKRHVRSASLSTA
jgi:hypothetical protein